MLEGRVDRASGGSKAYIYNGCRAQRCPIPRVGYILHQVARELRAAVKIREVLLSGIGVLAHVLEQILVAGICEVKRRVGSFGDLVVLCSERITKSDYDTRAEAAVEERHIV